MYCETCMFTIYFWNNNIYYLDYLMYTCWNVYEKKERAIQILRALGKFYFIWISIKKTCCYACYGDLVIGSEKIRRIFYASTIDCFFKRILLMKYKTFFKANRIPKLNWIKLSAAHVEFVHCNILTSFFSP